MVISVSCSHKQISSFYTGIYSCLQDQVSCSSSDVSCPGKSFLPLTQRLFSAVRSCPGTRAFSFFLHF